ncbi:ABC1-domain-containing protein [Aulographum hederae CBS 113979]|uniref:ABC1-domain-containing protein n=1 Tax=Aulographum hederae CBS 113979 TaxID=1176131 RepID=A0A6G1H067_9PEZI|nr:ABC1-domain-containing protein [Aulographum hederae CBS 113979]
MSVPASPLLPRLLRRTTTVLSTPSSSTAAWRACFRRAGETTHFQQRAGYATQRVHTKPQSQPLPRSTVKATPRPRKRSKVRSRILLLAGGGAVTAGVLAVSEDARHAGVAVQRSARVARTLAVNINDYRVTLNNDPAQDDYQTLLKACHKRCAERTLVTLEKNGSIFIKLGQHLSSLNYLLPTEWCETFIPLQDKCPVSSFESVEELVLKDTGQPLSDFFSEFESVPIGAASLAQVHRATVKETGERVAVKVQHPALDEWAPLDLALTSFAFDTIKKWFPEYDMTWLAEEMQTSLPQELDFNREAENAMRAKEYFANVKSAPLIIPTVIWAKRRILVMEYVTGHRPDDLAYLDANHIDRDEVSAALARIFNEMIFGANAPLHCDPHGGNIAVRHNPNRRSPSNFDIILYDHGLYRSPDIGIRRSYAKLWLAVINGDEKGMRQYAKDLAGISDEYFPLFASAITGRDFSVVRQGIDVPKSEEEKETITNALGDGMLADLVKLLGSVPRVLLLILKTNDLTRSLDESLHTRQGPVRSFLILARYASRTVYEEQMENLQGSIFWPPTLFTFLGAWKDYMKVRLQLRFYESWLALRGRLGLAPVM